MSERQGGSGAGAAEPEVIVAGLGMPGATLALALAQAGVRVTAVDAAPLEARLAPEFDGRASAIGYANMRLWDVLGLGEALRAEAQPITSILVTDMSAPGAAARRAQPVFLRFDAEDARAADASLSDDASVTLGLDPRALGWMVENRRLRSVLATALEAAGVQVLAPAKVASVTVDARAATVRLADGADLSAPLVVGAEGRRSTVREAAGIGVNGWAYKQAGVVATVQLSAPHDGVAHEMFLPGGPLAVLPMTGDRANLVWTERADRARALAEASPSMFEAHLARRFGEVLGAPRLIGARHVHPMGLQVAERMTAPRIALIGDAAHVIHPIAGQGLNMGLKDAAALAEVIVEARRLGEDFGSEIVLDRYARWRRFDSATLAMATDLFTRLFSNDDPVTRLVRGAGLSVVNRLPAAKRLFTREAGGALGDLPRMLRGEGL